jgi:cytochrome c oxidase cbb3-type subunit 3
MKIIIRILLCASLFISLVKAEDTVPSIQRGAEVFLERCSLCHGNQAMGEGKLSLKLKDYPNTNLLKIQKAKSLDDIKKVVIYGGILDSFSYYMPPFGNELSWTEIESVSLFVEKARAEPSPHLSLLQNLADKSEKSRFLGRETFAQRCALCHGVNGEGDGRMARVIKDPPPFDLTKSVMPEDYLRLIINKGGESIARSPQMPPWIDQLSQQEVTAVINYIIQLRK